MYYINVTNYYNFLICSVDFIYIELFTRIILIWYSIFKYFIGPDWNYSLLWIYWIE